MMHKGVRVTHSRVEEVFTLAKEGARPNGLQYDAARDELLVADQADGDLITVARPRSEDRCQTVFAAGSPKPSGVVRCPFEGEDSVVMAGTYGRELTVVRGEEVFAVDHRGVGSGIVDFAQDLVKGTHTGFHGLEWDGSALWAASPPGKALLRLQIEERVVVGCDFFPCAFGNRPHGLAWADEAKTQLWCNDTTLGAVYRYDIRSGACQEIIVLPEDAPESHGMTMVGGRLWYCEDKSGKICEVVPR